MKPLNSLTRIGSMLLDHIIMTLVLSILVYPVLLWSLIDASADPQEPPVFILANSYIPAFAFSLYFNKDLFQGQSLAKRVLKLQIINIRTGQPARPLQCLIRNLTIIIWPIEVIIALISPERRLGDYLAGTRLVHFINSKPNTQIDWFDIGVSILLAFGIMYGLQYLVAALIFRDLTGLLVTI